jgi:uncharacterized protein YaiI (UPF0178 family)
MKIYIDADACPVVGQTESIAGRYGIPVVLLCDTNHVISSSSSEVVIVGAGSDAVDFELVNRCKKGDIVVTQDYGLASMALGRGAYPIHQSGMWYTEENIDSLLAQRHINRTARRRSGKSHLKGPAKRTAGDNNRYEASLINLIESVKHKNEDSDP